jgi:hypothetical protein
MLENSGKLRAARITIIAITTSNSVRVKAAECGRPAGTGGRGRGVIGGTAVIVLLPLPGWLRKRIVDGRGQS